MAFCSNFSFKFVSGLDPFQLKFVSSKITNLKIDIRDKMIFPKIHVELFLKKHHGHFFLQLFIIINFIVIHFDIIYW